MINKTKIKRRLGVKEFVEIVGKYKEDEIECTAHTFFRLSEKQRKFFTCLDLKRILVKEKPFLVGVQYNENYAMFYKYQNKNLKMIINLSDRKVKIVTFYFIEEWQIPRI